MVGRWQSVPLSKACKTIYRYPSFYGLERHDQGVPVVRGEHLLPNGTISTDFEDYWFVTEECSSRFPKTRLELHDVAMSVRGSIGTFARVGTAHVGAQISPNLIRLSPDPQVVDPVFFYYALMDSAAGAFIASTSSSSAVPAIRAADIKLAMIPVPPLPDQRAIAHILSAFDDKIELNLRMNETLEVMARALFKSWFIDFDPVHAKAEGRDPGLPADIAALFPDSFEDSDLGEVPKGWDVLTLHDLAHHVTRGISPVYMDAGGVCVLNQKCIRERRVDFSKARRHDSTKKPVEGKTLHMLDVLVNSTGVGTLGRVAQLWNLPEDVVTDSHVTTVQAKPEVDPHYLGIMLTGREGEIEALGEGSTGQTELSRARLSELPCLTPPCDLQNQFGRAAEPLLTLIAANEQESLTLATMRDTLLPRLLSGELRVKNVGRSMEAHV